MRDKFLIQAISPTFGHLTATTWAQNRKELKTKLADLFARNYTKIEVWERGFSRANSAQGKERLYFQSLDWKR